MVQSMCESSVYLVNGSMRTLVMPEAARILVTGEGVVCFDIAGGRKTVEGAVLAEADLMRHQIILMPKQS